MRDGEWCGQSAVRERGAVGVAVGSTIVGLPERYGKDKSVHKRFTPWARAGVWERVFVLLARDRDNAYPMIDSSIVRAHAQTATGQKGVVAIRLWGAPAAG